MLRLTLAVSLLLSLTSAAILEKGAAQLKSNSTIDNDAWKPVSLICYENGFLFEEYHVTHIRWICTQPYAYST